MTLEQKVIFNKTVLDFDPKNVEDFEDKLKSINTGFRSAKDIQGDTWTSLLFQDSNVESTLVFCPSKKNTENHAKYILSEFKK